MTERRLRQTTGWQRAACGREARHGGRCAVREGRLTSGGLEEPAAELTTQLVLPRQKVHTWKGHAMHTCPREMFESCAYGCICNSNITLVSY